MKEFVKMVLAVICGILILSIVSFFLTFAMIGAMAAAGSGKPVLPKSGVLSLDLSKVMIAEQTQDGGSLSNFNPNTLLAGGEAPASVIGIWDAVQAINAAAEDPAVQFIFLRTDGNATGVTALGELRVALERFRTSGKPVVSYMESPGTASLYIASVSDKIYMNSSLGLTPQFTGVGSQMVFLGDLLKRLGVNVQLIRHGKYKSAGEMYTRGSSSPENREQYQRMIDSMWEVIGAAIAESRGISLEELDAAIEGLKFRLPQDFVDCKLVDELLDRKGLEDKLTTLAVADKYKDIKWIAFDDYVDAKLVASKAKQKIAVIYADGEIIDGKGKTEIAGDRFAAVIEKVAADSTVKAVVLRVNSPGGSVTASEKIKNELDRLQQAKPLVASYGDYAASGGYWISSSADRIFCSRSTLTGSIGVFGLIPVFGDAVKKHLKINTVTLKTHPHSDAGKGFRMLDEEETEAYQKSIERVYDRFVSLVAESRGKTREEIDAIAQGRVWAGRDAMGIGLVDEFGTLMDAIRYAAGMAGLKNWQTVSYPIRKKGLKALIGDDDPAPLVRLPEVMAPLAEYGTAPQILARLPYDAIIR